MDSKTNNKVKILWGIWGFTLVLTIAIVIFGWVKYPLQGSPEGQTLLITNWCNNISATKPTAWPIDIWEVFIRFPLRAIIYWASAPFGFNWIIGITIATIIVKLLTAPWGIKSQLATRSNEKIKEESLLMKSYYQKTGKPEKELQQDQMLLQKRFGLNQFAGCLPSIWQMIFFIVFYQAIYFTPIFLEGTFFGINLAEANHVLALLAGFTTYLSTVTMTMGQTKELQNSQQQSMNSMMKWMMPLMITVFAWAMPAAMTIYWVMSNLISAIQNVVVWAVYKK